jgi:hypothetical protein
VGCVDDPTCGHLPSIGNRVQAPTSVGQQEFRDTGVTKNRPAALKSGQENKK